MSDVFKFNNGLRFLDKNRNDNERDNYDGWWKEQLHLYGTEVEYFTNMMSLTGNDQIYGEQPAARFKNPRTLILALNLNENAVAMKQFGLIADDEITGFVHIKTYYEVFGSGEEPKSGDVFNLIELGADRPGGRGGKHFEITERLDQDVNQINQLLGHYVWLIKAKRHDYSFEPGLSPEPVSDQVNDDPIVDGLSKEVFDYNESPFTINDDVYGDYV
tara:strand:+ start:110 stop:760 length:651 start_codon:yes stop_codon:yes gene_type:complete